MLSLCTVQNFSCYFSLKSYVNISMQMHMAGGRKGISGRFSKGYKLASESVFYRGVVQGSMNMESKDDRF